MDINLLLIMNVFYGFCVTLVIIGLSIIFYPLITGRICSWNAPCGFETGYDCTKCNHGKISTGIVETIIQLLTFSIFAPKVKK